MLLCPYCEGQGIIHTAVVKATGEDIYICGECDSVWFRDDRGETQVQPFEYYMEERGLKALVSFRGRTK